MDNKYYKYLRQFVDHDKKNGDIQLKGDAEISFKNAVKSVVPVVTNDDAGVSSFTEEEPEAMDTNSRPSSYKDLSPDDYVTDEKELQPRVYAVKAAAAGDGGIKRIRRREEILESEQEAARRIYVAKPPPGVGIKKPQRKEAASVVKKKRKRQHGKYQLTRSQINLLKKYPGLEKL